MNALPGIGNARSTKFGRQATTAATYAMAASEFDNESSIPAQKGLASPVFRDPSGNLYIFRVLETDPAREANSVEEVRDAVVADATNLSRFNKIESMASELETDAVENGLQPIATRFETQVRYTPDLAEADARLLAYGIKNAPRIPGLSKPETVIDAIVARASELDYTVPATDLPISDRTLVIPDEESLTVAVAQITAIKPLTKEGWNELAASSGMIRVLATEDTAVDFTKTFSLEELIKRHNFKSLRGNSDEELIEDAEVEGLDATPEEAEATATG